MKMYLLPSALLHMGYLQWGVNGLLTDPIAGLPSINYITFVCLQRVILHLTYTNSVPKLGLIASA